MTPKWNLWHGNVHKALQIVEDLEYDLDLEENSLEQRKLLKAVREFETYITANRTFIPNYGDRYWHAETISTVDDFFSTWRPATSPHLRLQCTNGSL